MRIGLVGPTDNPQLFREAATFLLTQLDANPVIYLGDGQFAQDELARWSAELGGNDIERSFLDRAIEFADAGPDEIEALLADDAVLTRLRSIHRLPDPPARAVEMIDDRLLLFVYDKGVLDEEDIANAHMIVYGRGETADLRRFGRRVFFTPGPLATQRVGLLEATTDGLFALSYDLTGPLVWREALAFAATKVIVAT